MTAATKSSLRSLPPGLRAALKHAALRLIAEAGGIHEAAKLAGISPAQMGRYQAGSEPDLMPLDVALVLTAATGGESFGDLFADLAGCRLVAQREADEPAPAEMPALMGGLSEAAEVIHLIGAALADGVISPTERGQIRRGVADLKDQLSDIERATAGDGAQAARSAVAGQSRAQAARSAVAQKATSPKGWRS